jgi:hypothetical protein
MTHRTRHPSVHFLSDLTFDAFADTQCFLLGHPLSAASPTCGVWPPISEGLVESADVASRAARDPGSRLSHDNGSADPRASKVLGYGEENRALE